MRKQKTMREERRWEGGAETHVHAAELKEAVQRGVAVDHLPAPTCVQTGASKSTLGHEA